MAILSNTFATINADAAAESMFRKAVSTLEGVKGGKLTQVDQRYEYLTAIYHRLRLQLSAALQSCCSSLHVAALLHIITPMVSSGRGARTLERY